MLIVKDMKTYKNTAKLFLAIILVLSQFETAAANADFRTLDMGSEQVLKTKNVIRKSFYKADEKKLDKIAQYMAYVGLTPEKSNFKFQLARLTNSSLQFILCDNVEDWACLEKKPEITPKAKMRVDVATDLGKPILAGDSLELEYYFTQGWYDNFTKKSESYVLPQKTVAQIMSEKIKSEGQKNIWMSIYGIDDITGTMEPVYKAIEDRVNSGVNTYAVMDVSDEQQANGFPRDYNITKLEDGRYALGNKKIHLDYSYVNVKDVYNAAFEVPGWAEEYFKDIQSLKNKMSNYQLRKYLLNDYFIKPPATTKIYDLQVFDLAWLALNKTIQDYRESVARISFQYANNLQLLRLLNKNAKTNSEARARIEFPFTGIMHNKFVVFEKNNGEKSVWTGTTNVSRTCMGDESNSNLVILIKNDSIAKTFLDEFNEMFSGYSSSSTKPSSLLTGAFHDKKRPNTNRYFIFKDSTEVRVHFSPTDDGEHRVLLPLIYSARSGDILRISMFGGGGFELVRAMQSAVARGVDIRIVFDNLTGAGSTSWWKSKDANLLEKNPYSETPTGSVQVRKNDWPGLNHHKTATLTRRLADGSYKAEVIVIGSQNWSQTGNDKNDENMITVRNVNKELDIMTAFNREFDSRLWVASSPVDKKSSSTQVGSAVDITD